MDPLVKTIYHLFGMNAQIQDYLVLDVDKCLDMPWLQYNVDVDKDKYVAVAKNANILLNRGNEGTIQKFINQAKNGKWQSENESS